MFLQISNKHVHRVENAVTIISGECGSATRHGNSTNLITIPCFSPGLSSASFERHDVNRVLQVCHQG